MARKEPPKSRRKTPDASAQAIIDAALALAREEAWQTVSLSDIADKAGISLAQGYAAFPSKAAIVGGFMKRIDQQVLDGGVIDITEPARDRLFEVLMRRFDALAPHKVAVAAILDGLCAKPTAALAQAPRVLCSMAWMLEAARLPADGLIGLVRIKGLTLIYANALRVWLADDTQDMARTMAALDQGLGRAERLAHLCCPRRRKGEENRDPAPA